jgi:hypothetical protein
MIEAVPRSPGTPAPTDRLPSRPAQKLTDQEAHHVSLQHLQPTPDHRRRWAHLAFAVGSLVVPAASFASSGTEVHALGSCTLTSTADLTAQHDSGRIEVDFEIDHSHSQAWTVRITDNGHRVFSGTRQTSASSDSFTVKRLIRNRAGTDRIVVRATNAATGEVCKASLRV